MKFIAANRKTKMPNAFRRPLVLAGKISGPWFSVAGIVLATAGGRAQSIADNSFDANFTPSNGNYSPSFASSTSGGNTVTLGGTGKAAYFDANNTGNVPSSWSLAGTTGSYGYWLHNVGTPASTPNYIWLGSNETCLQNTITGLTGGQTYKVSVSLAGWKGTITDSGAPQGVNGSPWTITQNHAALEFQTATSPQIASSSQLSGSLVPLVTGWTYAEFAPTVSAKADSLSWLTASVNVTVPLGQNSISFYLSPVVPGQENGSSVPSNGLFADSVTVVSAVPEPSTWAAGAAMALIGLWQWRSRRTRCRQA